MKRWAVRICVLLFCGAIVNIAVAWGFSIVSGSGKQIRKRVPSSPPEFHIPWKELEEADRALLSHAGWSSSIDDDRGIWVDQSTRNEFGLELIAYLPFAQHNLLQGKMSEDYRTDYRYWHVDRPGFAWVIHVEAGWPMSCLGETQFHRFAVAPLPRKVELESAIRPPELFAMLPKAEGHALPIRVIWPGFAINTIFYAAILWGMFAIPFALRRRLRTKRGLCPKCV